LVHRGKLKDFGHQTQSSASRETLYAILETPSKNKKPAK